MEARELKIRERAYALWERANRPDGQHHAHWFQALQEIASEEAIAGSQSDQTAEREDRSPATSAPGGRRRTGSSRARKRRSAESPPGTPVGSPR